VVCQRHPKREYLPKRNAVDKICQAFSFSAFSLKWIQAPNDSHSLPDVAGVRLMTSDLGNRLAIGDGK
jgi:hypothetical protein